MAAFVFAYNQLVTEKKEIIVNVEIIRRALCVTDALQEEKYRLEDEMSVFVEMMQNIVTENARVAQDQTVAFGAAWWSLLRSAETRKWR